MSNPTAPPLQPGAELLPQIQTVHLDRWMPQDVDASIEVHGVRWYRVLGGFGGRFNREDWIADTPGVSICVSDYHWNGEDFGPVCRGHSKVRRWTS